MAPNYHNAGTTTARFAAMSLAQHAPEPVLILVVEDSPDILFILKTDLEQLGYAVEVASDGRGGLAAAQRSRPHLILTDIHMPEMDGFEFVEQLRQCGAGGVPVVALTGGIAHTEKAAECFAAVITKPVDPDTLHTLIRRLLPDATPDRTSK